MGNTDSQEQRLIDNASTTMYNLAFSHVISQYLYVIAKLDVATIIGKAGKSLTAEEIAKEHGSTINTEFLQRMLRLLSSTKGIFNESKTEEDVRPAFGLTNLSQLLRSDVPGQQSFRNIVLHHAEAPVWRAWSHTEQCVTSTEPEIPWQKENGMAIWEYYRQHPESAEVFNNCMTENSQIELDAIMLYFGSAWKEFENRKATVVDIGGGHGHELARVKKQYPELNCKVVDLKEVIDSAPTEEYGIDFIVGDIFKPDTLPKTDVIFMKHILHDWNDEDSKKILESCHLALNKDGTLILAEIILPCAGEPVKTRGLNPFMVDAHMMTIFCSKERTVIEWSKLLEISGFKLVKIVETPVPTCQMMVALKS